MLYIPAQHLSCIWWTIDRQHFKASYFIIMWTRKQKLSARFVVRESQPWIHSVNCPKKRSVFQEIDQHSKHHPPFLHLTCPSDIFQRRSIQRCSKQPKNKRKNTLIHNLLHTIICILPNVISRLTSRGNDPSGFPKAFKSDKSASEFSSSRLKSWLPLLCSRSYVEYAAIEQHE